MVSTEINCKLSSDIFRGQPRRSSEIFLNDAFLIMYIKLWPQLNWRRGQFRFGINIDYQTIIKINNELRVKFAQIERTRTKIIGQSIRGQIFQCPFTGHIVDHLRESHFQYKEKIYSPCGAQIDLLEKTSVDSKQGKTYHLKAFRNIQQAQWCHSQE